MQVKMDSSSEIEFVPVIEKKPHTSRVDVTTERRIESGKWSKPTWRRI
jgi:hypothetical protein